MKETDYKTAKNALERVCGTGDSKKEDGHYVYALIDPNGEVFYIGEGTGDRVLAHEEEFETERKEIIQEYEAEIEEAKRESDLSEIERLEKERNSKLDFFNAKLNTIKKIKEEGKEVKQIIIKYGMKKQEAFYAESALINLMQYLYQGKETNLTNLINGHSTKMEKLSRSPDGKRTKARDLETFMKECDAEPLNVSDIKKEILEKAVFINIKATAKYCRNDNDYWQAVRGCWGFDKEKAKKIEYVFAIYGPVVHAVFKIIPKQVKSFLSADNSDVPIEPRELRKQEGEFATFIGKIIKENDLDSLDESAKMKTLLDDETVMKMFKKMRRDSKINKESYKKAVNEAVYDRFGSKKASNKPRALIAKRVKEEKDSGKNAAEVKKLLYNDKSLRKLWEKEQLKLFLNRSYFSDKALIRNDEEGKLEYKEYCNKCLKKTDNGIEVDITSGIQTPFLYGENLVKQKKK